ncbi:hypothetical protein Moror_13144 [Moniliophthora roreri MCA 2997]|uniref:Mid2 domain-containing protein n=1 Tax=Moniliophthora roreri (strain MCA 2997) TaxID=1381753 RepID=V2X918_MONRO|nr:hypothetical protein Moror_13144 [Moniliophthora roreri MCA 2997]
MLFLICRILVVVALAKAIQAQGTFSGIPDKTVAGSQLNVGFQYSGSVRIGDVSFDFIRDGGSTQRRTIRIRLGISAQLRIQTLTVPRVAGTYRVQATYDDSSGNTHRDLSSPFVAFAEGEDPGVLPEPSSTATPSSTTSESSTQSTSEPTAVTEQTTPKSSTSIAVDTDPTFSRTQTSTSSAISTGMSSTGMSSTGMSSTGTGQRTTSTISATQSSAVSSRKSKAAIIAGSVVGTATLIVLLVLIAVRRRRKKKTYRDGLSVQPYTFYSHLERRRKLREVEESGQEEGEDGVREARSEVAFRVHANRVRQSIVVVHEDSGWRPDQTSTAGDARVVDLPPGYDAAR